MSVYLFQLSFIQENTYVPFILEITTFLCEMYFPAVEL